VENWDLKLYNFGLERYVWFWAQHEEDDDIIFRAHETNETQAEEQVDVGAGGRWRGPDCNTLNPK